MRKRLFVTGDMHGDYTKLCKAVKFLNQFIYDEVYLAVMGDFGFLFLDNENETKILNDIEQQKFNLIVIPGNHENYKAFQTYPVVDFFGAKAYRVRKNIHYIVNGEIFRLENKSFFCMGGGYSIDRYMRKKDYSYWEEELPGDAEFKHATKTINKYREDGNKIEYIFSHTAPLSGLAYLGMNHGAEEYPLNNFLEYVNEILFEEKIMHYFGHLHIDKKLSAIKQRAIMHDFDEIILS